MTVQGSPSRGRTCSATASPCCRVVARAIGRSSRPRGVQARTAAHFPWRNTVEPQHGVWWVTDGPPVRGFFAWGYGGQFVLRRARSGSRRGGRDRMVVPRYCRCGDGGQRLLRSAIHRFRPRHVVALFSGGHDSLVATHIASSTKQFRFALHINTGIGIPATRDFVLNTCARLLIPLREY